MIRRIASFIVASALLLIGLAGAYVLLFIAAKVPVGLLAGSGFFAAIGGYWLWLDFVAPLLRNAAE